MTSPKLLRMASVSLLLIALVLGAFALGGAEKPRPYDQAATWDKLESGQLIFFAVLEGLYRDGVSNDDVDRIIPPDQNGKRAFTAEHFVYACPLCHPTYEAFRLYRQRDNFFGMKARINTFGPGLGGSVADKLRSGDATQRRQAIEEMISRWVSQRMELMRLTKAERETITREIEQGRKRGMNGLQQANASVGQSRTNCPICDGSFGACQLKTP